MTQNESIASRKDIDYHMIIMKNSFTESKFIKQEKYMTLDEKHIFQELQQMIQVIRERFNKCNSKKYLQKKVDSD